MRFSSLYGALALLISVPSLPAAGPRAVLTQIENFGQNPSGAGMFIYVPTKLATKIPIIVALHYCTGTAREYYYGSPYAKLADQYGFIVIYPSSPYRGTCWDVSSKKALTHNGGGDSNAIANMVTYALVNYDGDATKVFVTGSSSGAMMTNVLVATYPELFAAATAYSGVPAGCFLSNSDQADGWNDTCAQGHVRATENYWADTVYAMYPRYTGQRPRVQIYHGSRDTTLHSQNYNETVKEWTGVFGYSYADPEKVANNFPHEGYTTNIWGVDVENPLGKVQGIYARGVGHTVPINGTQDMMWFGLGPYASSDTPASTIGAVQAEGSHSNATRPKSANPSYAGA